MLIHRKRILVTGGAGFIGSHLCDRLLTLGHEVICIDNLFTGNTINLSHNLQHSRYEFYHHDITQPFSADVDFIYNLACPASPVHYQHDPIKTMKVSVFGALNVLDLARDRGIPVVQASTSEVYGDPHIHPQPESYWGNVNPVGPRSCYDEGKRSAETLFSDYRRHHGVDTKIVRIFNTYGPRMTLDDGRVISNFVVQALRGEPLTIYGDGSHTRSFCFVDDLVDGLVALMDTAPDVSGPINLGNPEEITIRDLAGAVAELCGVEARFKHGRLPQDDPSQRQPDISQASALLGWRPRTTLRDGLKRTIMDFEMRVVEVQ